VTAPTRDGYLHADAAARLLGIRPATISRLSRREGWRRIRDGHAWLYLLTDIRTTERKRRTR